MIACSDALTWLGDDAIQTDAFETNQALPLRTRPVRLAAMALEKTIQPITGSVRRHDDHPRIWQLARLRTQRGPPPFSRSHLRHVATVQRALVRARSAPEAQRRSRSPSQPH